MFCLSVTVWFSVRGQNISFQRCLGMAGQLAGETVREGGGGGEVDRGGDKWGEEGA